MPIELADAEVIDNHCHGFSIDGLLAVPPEDVETRLTLMGTGFSSSSQADPEMWDRTRALTETTAFALLARRWLASRLACEPTAEAVAEARREALS